LKKLFLIASLFSSSLFALCSPRAGYSDYVFEATWQEAGGDFYVCDYLTSDGTIVAITKINYVVKRYRSSPLPALSIYDKDPAGCQKNGGTMIGVGTKVVGATGYGASFFGGQGIMLGGDIEQVTKCASTSEALGTVATQILGLIPMASSLFKSGLLKYFANKAVKDYIDTEIIPKNSLANLNPKAPNTIPDLTVGLPKLKAPNSSDYTPTTPFKISDIPPTADGSGPSRVGLISPDNGYSMIGDTFIPTHSDGTPLIDYSVVDRFNILNTVTANPIPLIDVVSPPFTTSTPVKESFDLSNLDTSYSSPPTIATVPTKINDSSYYAGTDLLTKYTAIKNYPDGSSSSSELLLNTVNGKGSLNVTILSPTGETSTIYKPVIVTGQNSFSDPAHSTIALDTTIDTGAGTDFGSSNWTNYNKIATWETQNPTAVNPATNTVTPDAITGQDPNTIINATMPNYNFSDTGDFEHYNNSSSSSMVDEANLMFTNIKTQLTAVKTTFDSTKALLNGSWKAPVFDSGDCGNFMAFNFHGERVDLCPPLINFSSQASPLFSSTTAIAGTGFALSIFFGGL